MHRLLARLVLMVGCAILLLSVGRAAAQEKETPSAKATRKKLAKKISVDWDDTPLKVAMDDIKTEFDNRLGIKIDNVSGISNNSKVKFKADNQPLEKILNDFCKKYEMGWFVYSKKGDRYDGWIWIRKGNERGYEKGKEPAAKETFLAPAPGTPPLAARRPALLLGLQGPEQVAILNRR